MRQSFPGKERMQSRVKCADGPGASGGRDAGPKVAGELRWGSGCGRNRVMQESHGRALSTRVTSGLKGS